MRAFHFVCATAFVGLAACAPVQSKTHFQRWDEHAAKIAAETPADESAPAPASTPAAPAATAAPAAAPVYGASSGTPAITSTSTKSRVVRPGDKPAGTADEDVIY